MEPNVGLWWCIAWIQPGFMQGCMSIDALCGRAFKRVSYHLPVAARDLARERLALVLRSLAARLHLLRAHPARVEQLLRIEHDALLTLGHTQPHHDVEVAWARGGAGCAS